MLDIRYLSPGSFGSMRWNSFEAEEMFITGYRLDRGTPLQVIKNGFDSSEFYPKNPYASPHLTNNNIQFVGSRDGLNKYISNSQIKIIDYRSFSELRNLHRNDTSLESPYNNIKNDNTYLYKIKTSTHNSLSIKYGIDKYGDKFTTYIGFGGKSELKRENNILLDGSMTIERNHQFMDQFPHIIKKLNGYMYSKSEIDALDVNRKTINKGIKNSYNFHYSKLNQDFPVTEFISLEALDLAI